MQSQSLKLGAPGCFAPEQQSIWRKHRFVPFFTFCAKDGLDRCGEIGAAAIAIFVSISDLTNDGYLFLAVPITSAKHVSSTACSYAGPVRQGQGQHICDNELSPQYGQVNTNHLPFSPLTWSRQSMHLSAISSNALTQEGTRCTDPIHTLGKMPNRCPSVCYAPFFSSDPPPPTAPKH